MRYTNLAASLFISCFFLSFFFKRLKEKEEAALIFGVVLYLEGRVVAYWLRHYATNRQVAGSIPDGVIGIFQ